MTLVSEVVMIHNYFYSPLGTAVLSIQEFQITEFETQTSLHA